MLACQEFVRPEDASSKNEDVEMMCGHTKRDMIRNQEIVRACEVEKHKCPVRRCETLAMVGMRIGRGRPKK